VGLLYRRKQTVNQFPRALEQSRFRDHLVESGRVRAAQPGRVGVIRIPENRDIRVRIRNVHSVDARDVRDHEIGRLDAVDGHETMLRQDPLELAPDEEVDPTQQDRRHV
jgi:hypothetical protein